MTWTRKERSRFERLMDEAQSGNVPDYFMEVPRSVYPGNDFITDTWDAELNHAGIFVLRGRLDNGREIAWVKGLGPSRDQERYLITSAGSAS